MNVLQISSLYPPHVGGIENHVETLSRNLVENDNKVTVYTSNIPISKNQEEVNGINIVRFKCYFSPLNNQFIPGLFLEMLKKSDFDLIHVHSHLHISSNISVLANALNDRKPIILTSHGTVNYTGWKNIINSVYNKFISERMFNSVDKTIALTPNQSQILKGMGAKSKNISIIPNGVDLKRINLSLKKENIKNLYKLDSQNIILFVGGLIPRKGINFLIEAMQYVKPNSILFIVGGEIPGHNKYILKLKEQIKYKNLNNVLFLGRVSQLELDYLYTIADLFVLPSLSEGLPLTLLDAMAYKKCIIASNIPGNADVIANNKTGILVEPKQSLKLAETINSLLNDPFEREMLGENARAEVEKNYDLKKTIKSTIDLYHQII